MSRGRYGLAPRRSLAPLVAVAAIVAGCGDDGARSPDAQAHAQAPLACTITWVGPRRTGEWSQPLDWAPPRLPDMTDRACIARGHVVRVSDGRYVVGSLEADGEVIITNAVLAFFDAAVTSQLRDVRIDHGDVLGNADVNVHGHATIDAGAPAVPRHT